MDVRIQEAELTLPGVVVSFRFVESSSILATSSCRIAILMEDKLCASIDVINFEYCSYAPSRCFPGTPANSAQLSLRWLSQSALLHAVYLT